MIQGGVVVVILLVLVVVIKMLVEMAIGELMRMSRTDLRCCRRQDTHHSSIWIGRLDDFRIIPLRSCSCFSTV